MLMTRRAIDEVGPFDMAFGRGYGEEVDWCQRAWARGYASVICDDVYVFHHGEAGFSHVPSRNALRRANERRVDERWPHYMPSLQAYCMQNPLRLQQQMLFERLRRPPAAKLRVLHVTHSFDRPAGTEIFVRQHVDGMRDDVASTVLYPVPLSPFHDGAVEVEGRGLLADGLLKVRMNAHLFATDHVLRGTSLSLRAPAVERFFGDVVAGAGADVVQFSHFANLGSLALPLVAKAMGAKVVVVLHDYFLLCPDWNLLHADGTACGEAKADASSPRCIDCLAQRMQSRPSAGVLDLPAWLEQRTELARAVLERADALVAPSKFVREQFARAHGAGIGERVRVIPHGTPAHRFEADYAPRRELRVAFVGNATRIKGIDTFVEAARRLRDRPVRFRILGGVHPGQGVGVTDNLELCGSYPPRELSRLLQDVDVVVIGSVVHETYCYTLDEAFRAGAPVVATAMGAIPERVAEGTTALLVPPGDADALVAAIRPPRRRPRAARGDEAPCRGDAASYRRPDRAGLPAAVRGIGCRPRRDRDGGPGDARAIHAGTARAHHARGARSGTVHRHRPAARAGTRSGPAAGARQRTATLMPESGSRRERRHGALSRETSRTIARLLHDAQHLYQAGRLPQAIAACERALALDPRNLDALCAYARLANAADRAEVAADTARRAIAIEPACASARHALGTALRRLGLAHDAIASLGRALELEPDRVDVLIDLCHAFLDAGDPRGAQPFLDRALDADVESADAQIALGRLYQATGRLDDATARYRRAVQLDARSWEAEGRLGILLRDAGEQDKAIAAFERAIALAPWRPDLWSNLFLTLQCSDQASAQDVAERHREFGRRFGTLVHQLPSPPTAHAARGRLRIGYVSSNFRRHAVAKFFEPLLAAHDRDRFEVHCYYNFPTTDEVTDRIRARAEHFTPVWGASDGHVAAQVRRDGIDILVDLDGHTLPNRLAVFLLRAAPVQVTWLGYLATTGLGTIDYRLTDVRADPPGVADRLHTEALWRLPRTAWCYRPYDEARQTRRTATDANGSTTFVSLNNPGKVNASMLELWARIMQELEQSRLVLHVSTQPSRINGLERFFSARGITPERLTLVGRQSIADYLQTYVACDIALDTWPCAGGTTTCDALWMGVPVVTLAGTGSYSRTGASLLANAGLPELVTDSPDTYVETAIALARDRSRLATLRGSLRETMRSSCLTDRRAFARDIEAAFEAMWERRSHATGA